MKRIPLTLTLVDPLVLNTNNITTGMPDSLDYIPGAAILGAIAARTYPHFKQHGLNETIFHSGQVRFGNGRIVHEKEPCYPIPLSYHYEKTGDQNQIYNLLYQSPQGQPKQHRKGYLSPSAKIITPKKHLHLRTAINEDTSTAKESQLFAYRSLQEGLVMSAHIDCDNEDIAQQLYQQIKDLAHIRIGRSRSAHYGRVKLEVGTPEKVQDEDYPLTELPIKNDTKTSTLILWLASDLAVYNQAGQPTLTPTLQDLGLSEHDTLPVKTYIRTRRYAPYNAYRKTYDLERQVIQQGSILCYEAKHLKDNWQEILQKGLGSYREAGLGKIVPLAQKQWATFITSPQIKLEKLNEHQKTESESPVLKEKPELLQWLAQEKETIDFKPEVNQFVEEWLNKLEQKIHSVRQYQGLKGKPVGPTKTQWGHLRNLMTRQEHSTAQEWIDALKNPQNGMMKDGDEQWQQKEPQGSFADFIFNVIKKAEQKAKNASGQDDNKFKHRFHLLMRAFARAVAHSDAIQKAHLDQANRQTEHA